MPALFFCLTLKPHIMAALGEYFVDNLEYVTECVEENYTEYEAQQLMHASVAGSISFAACMVGLFYFTLALRTTVGGLVKLFRK